MKILLVNGSVAQKSHTRALFAYLELLLTEKGQEVMIWDLKTSPIPIVLPEHHKDPTKHPNQLVRNFVETVENSEVIILGTPLYHGSYSGVLKNALDNLRWDAFRNKWVGMVGNAGTVRADQVSFSHLRHVINTLVGYSFQTQIGTNRDDYTELSDRYVLEDETIKERCRRFVDELIERSK